MKFLKPLGLLVAGLVLSQGVSSARASIVFTFDPDGGGGFAPAGVTTFDQQPGNALAVGVINAQGQLVTGTPFTLLYQATSNVVLNTTGQTVFSYGSSAGFVPGELTVVAKFFEVATGTGLSSASFSTDTSQVGSFFRIYYDPVSNANNLAGTGFTDGTLIYEGTVLRDGTGDFNISNTTPVNLDQNGGNNYPALKAVTGTGGSLVNVQTTFFNPNFFLTDISNSVLTFDSQNNIPFRHVDPSVKMFDGTPAATTGSLGSTDGNPGATGSPKNFLFAADASSSLSVPEPNTVAGALTGLAILTGFGWKRRNKAVSA